MKRTFLFLLVVAVVAVAGCSKKPANEKRYGFEGRVVAVNAATREITVAHKDIPGYMMGMTMPFKVKQDWPLKVAKPGDTLRADLVVSDEESYLDNVTLTQESGNAPPASEGLHLPTAGQAVPELTFVNQDGKTLKLSSLRGGPVLLTFIYTRCPLPDYCIRMSSNFGEIAKSLKAQQPAAWKKFHMLSVSFDTEFDKPEVLKNYGKNYAGDIDPAFQHWEFVSGSKDEIRHAADFFGLVYDAQEGQYIHSLRTALIDKNGKIVEVIHGNEWKPEELAQKIVQLQ